MVVTARTGFVVAVWSLALISRDCMPGNAWTWPTLGQVYSSNIKATMGEKKMIKSLIEFLNLMGKA